MARPKKEKAEALSEPFMFRLSLSEAHILRDKVARSGMKSGQFVRECVLANRTTIIAPPVASLDKKRMQFLFNKTSNNMNQIAHVLNSANTSGRLSESLCKDSLRALEEIAKYLKVALNHVD